MKISRRLFYSLIFLILVVSASLTVFLYLEREKQVNISFSDIEKELESTASPSTPFGRKFTRNNTYPYLYNYPPFELKPGKILSRYEIEDIVKKYLLEHSIYDFTILGVGEWTELNRRERIHRVRVKAGGEPGEIEFDINSYGIIIEVERKYGSWRTCYIVEIDERLFNNTFLTEFLRRELKAMGFPLTDEYSIEISDLTILHDIWSVSAIERIDITYYLTYKGYKIWHESYAELRFINDCRNPVIFRITTPWIEIFQLINEGRVRMVKNVDEEYVRMLIDYLSISFGTVYYADISHELVLLPVDVNCDYVYDVLELSYRIYVYPHMWLLYISAVTGEVIPDPRFGCFPGIP